MVDASPGVQHGRLFAAVGWAAAWARAAVTYTHRLRNEFVWSGIQSDVTGNDVSLRLWRFDRPFPVLSRDGARRLDQLHVAIGDAAMAWSARLVIARPDHESVAALHEISQTISSAHNGDRRNSFKGEASEGPPILSELRAVQTGLATEADADATAWSALLGECLPMVEAVAYTRLIADLAQQALHESQIVYRDVARALYEPLLPALPAPPDVRAARRHAVETDAGRSAISQWMYALARGGLSANEIEDTLRSLGPAYGAATDWWRATCAGSADDELPARLVLPR